MSRNRVLNPASLLAGMVGALLLSSPLFAQEAETEGEGDIVVTGRAEAPPTSTEVSRQARAITHPQSLRHEPLARFEDRLCPGVIGLKPDMASLVIDRIRDHAQQLDMRLTEDDGTCSPNLIVAFVDDGQASLTALEEKHGYRFQDLPLDERRELLSDTGPVHVWTTTMTRTRDGIPVPRSDRLGIPPVVNTWMAHSKIYLATREDIVSVLVLFDRERVKDKTLLQLADYATMRSIARTRPIDAEGQPMDTILSLFDDGATPPARMTDFDQAYLASLYDGIPNIPGATKVLGVNRHLRRQETEAAE